MIIYHYNIIEDIKNMIRTQKWYRNTVKKDSNFYWVWGTKPHPHKVIYFPPSFKRWIWIMWWVIFAKKPIIPEQNYYDCYWCSSGTWGSFYPKEKVIFIMPYAIEKSPDKIIQNVIQHEIIHIEEWEKTKNMSYEEREKYVESKAKAGSGVIGS